VNVFRHENGWKRRVGHTTRTNKTGIMEDKQAFQAAGLLMFKAFGTADAEIT
jgi:hypothetical protein